MTKPYFAGWYFRVSQPEAAYSLSIIVGIQYGKEEKSSFIQVMDTKSEISYFIKYPYHYFKLNLEPFYIKCGKSIFTKDFMYLNISTSHIELNGLLTFDKLVDIKRSYLSPTIMGPFSYLSCMECYHHVLSLDHKVNGVITLNNHKYFFDEGIGYIEGDSGTSFPKNYIWLQCNTFLSKDLRFMCSFAQIPLLKVHFKGLLCVLNINGKEHRFATYNGSYVEHYLINASQVYMVIRKQQYRLVIKAFMEEGKTLIAPELGNMKRHVTESLNGKILIKFYKKRKLLCEDYGELCGIEISKSHNSLY